MRDLELSRLKLGLLSLPGWENCQPVIEKKNEIFTLFCFSCILHFQTKTTIKTIEWGLIYSLIQLKKQNISNIILNLKYHTPFLPIMFSFLIPRGNNDPTCDYHPHDFFKYLLSTCIWVYPYISKNVLILYALYQHNHIMYILLQPASSVHYYASLSVCVNVMDLVCSFSQLHTHIHSSAYGNLACFNLNLLSTSMVCFSS